MKYDKHDKIVVFQQYMDDLIMGFLIFTGSGYLLTAGYLVTKSLVVPNTRSEIVRLAIRAFRPLLTTRIKGVD